MNVTAYGISVWVLPLIFAITFHEAAHGFVAHRLGDDTALKLGRVSFNPLRHIDPFGTLMLPAMLLFTHSPFLFGYAKPVPVNFRALRDPRLGMIMVALAGPATNILLALVAAAGVSPAPLVPAECAAMGRRQSQKCAPDQCRAGGVQHDADTAARRRPGRRRHPAAAAGHPAGPAGTVRNADPDRDFDPAAACGFAVRSKS